MLSADDDTLFAYANTREAIDEARGGARAPARRRSGATPRYASRTGMTTARIGTRSIRRPSADELAREERRDREAEAEAAREARIETRTVAVTSGRMVRNWFETTVADEARELGVELSIVEHPHLLSTQIVFTLTGPTGKIEQVIADMDARAGQATRLESAYAAPI